MNPIKKLFEEMPHEDLFTGIEEILELNKTGILKNGVVREYMKRTSEVTGEKSTATDLHMTTINFLQEAAFRWYMSVKITNHYDT